MQAGWNARFLFLDGSYYLAFCKSFLYDCKNLK